MNIKNMRISFKSSDAMRKIILISAFFFIMPESVFAGAGILFDGVTGYFMVKTSSLFPTSEEYSITGWIKTSQVRTSAIYCESASAPGSISVYSQISATGSLAIDAFPPSALFVVAKSSITTNKWINFTTSYRPSGVVAIYINGIIDINGSIGVYNDSAIVDFVYWGRRNNNVNHNQDGYFDGSMANMRVYNRFLSADEAMEIYTCSDSIVSGLAGSWTMMDSTAQKDLSINNNTAQSFSGTTSQSDGPPINLCYGGIPN